MNYHQLKISERILSKLKDKHKVNVEEIWECFINRTGGFLEDTRENNKTEPPTMWFIAQTDTGRLLKVVFIQVDVDIYEIKTAFIPNLIEVKLYDKYA